MLAATTTPAWIVSAQDTCEDYTAREKTHLSAAARSERHAPGCSQAGTHPLGGHPSKPQSPCSVSISLNRHACNRSCTSDIQVFGTHSLWLWRGGSPYRARQAKSCLRRLACLNEHPQAVQLKVRLKVQLNRTHFVAGV